jgi:hypothetical protein
MKNMKTIKTFALVTLVTGMMVSSCTKDPLSSTSVKFKIQATNNSYLISPENAGSKSLILTSGSFTFDTCLMVISKIDLEAELQQEGDFNDTTEIDFEWTGPKKVSLFDINSIIGEISLAPGIYDEISIKIESFKSDAGSSPVFYLSGIYSNSNGDDKRINVIVNEDFEIEVNNIDTLNAIYDYTAVVQMNLTLLMSGILQSDLDSAVLTNDKIVISSTSNVALYNKIKENLLECEDSEFEQE